MASGEDELKTNAKVNAIPKDIAQTIYHCQNTIILHWTMKYRERGRETESERGSKHCHTITAR